MNRIMSLVNGEKMSMTNGGDIMASNLVPTVLQKDHNGERAFDLYSRMLNDRIIFVDGEVNTTMASLVTAQLLYLDALDSEAPIQMYINSPGGSVTSGMAIHDTMQYISAPVSTIVTGMAASMGCFLLSAGEPGMRYALPNAEIMCHQPLISGGVGGQQTDIQITADNLLKTRNKLEKLMAEYTGVTQEFMNIACERDNWMSAEEAAAFGGKGFVDEVIKKKPRF